MQNLSFTVYDKEPTGERGGLPPDETSVLKLVAFRNHLNESRLAVFAGVDFSLHGAGCGYGVG